MHLRQTSGLYESLRPACLGLVLWAAVSLAPVTYGRADPPPATSTYLHTTTGAFQYSRRPRGWSIELFVQPRQTAPGGGPLYFEAVFENPRSDAVPLVVESSSLEPPVGNFGIKLEAYPVTGMQNGKAYRVSVNVYADKAHTKSLGTHQQAIVYHDIGDPEAVLQKLDAREGLAGGPLRDYHVSNRTGGAIDQQAFFADVNAFALGYNLRLQAPLPHSGPAVSRKLYFGVGISHQTRVIAEYGPAFGGALLSIGKSKGPSEVRDVDAMAAAFKAKFADKYTLTSMPPPPFR